MVSTDLSLLEIIQLSLNSHVLSEETLDVMGEDVPVKSLDDALEDADIQQRLATNELILGMHFGAVKREVPPPDSGPLQVIITVAGPSEPLVVRRKEHRFGIWVNVDAVEVDAAPSFYAVATSAPFDEVLSSIEDQRYEISINQAIRSVGAPMNISDSMSFTEALIRIRTKAGLYQLKPETVILDEQTLFRTSIALPANLTEGTYKNRIFLTRNGRVIDEYETAIEVSKGGLERWLFNLAQPRPEERPVVKEGRYRWRP